MNDVSYYIEQNKNLEGQIAELEETLLFKDEFLYFTVHELKTPMAVVYSALQTMEYICKDTMPDRAKGFIKTIKQNTNRQLRLVSNLLDIAKVKSGHVKIRQSNIDIIYLTRAIVSSVKYYSKLKGVKLSFRTTIKELFILVDDEKFERILLNLLSNAIKFTPSGHSIAVSITLDSIENKAICIKVKDSGIGIPEDKHKLIFERFEQVDNILTKETEGTGMGLSLTKLLITALNGTVTLKSKEGKGSTFTIQLPIKCLENIDEIATCCEMNTPLIQVDSRLIQATEIEFSDIYF